MFNMKAGCKVPFPEKLNECYMIEENMITANIDINKIRSVIPRNHGKPPEPPKGRC